MNDKQRRAKCECEKVEKGREKVPKECVTMRKRGRGIERRKKEYKKRRDRK